MHPKQNPGDEGQRQNVLPLEEANFVDLAFPDVAARTRVQKDFEGTPDVSTGEPRYLAIGEGVGIPNGGDMHIVERIHLVGPDTLHDDLEITAPHSLTAPWKTTRPLLPASEMQIRYR